MGLCLKWLLRGFLLCCISLSLRAELCPLQQLNLGPHTDFRVFHQQEANPAGVDEFLPFLYGEWWPLLGTHSDADVRLVYQQRSSDAELSSFIEQFFFYLRFDQAQSFSLGSLDFSIHKVMQLPLQNLRRYSAAHTESDCQSPEVFVWSVKNPFLPGSQLQLRFYGELRTKEIQKNPHVEIHFPGGKRIRLVRSDQHHQYGLNADEDLFIQRGGFPERNHDFRKISGVIDIQLTHRCADLELPINEISQLGHCLAAHLRFQKNQDFHGSLQINQRNGRSLLRLNLFPNDHERFEKEIYSGLAALHYSRSNFLWDQLKRNSIALRISNSEAPIPLDISPDRFPELTEMNGEGNWPGNNYELRLRISSDLERVELEYSEVLSQDEVRPGFRLLRALYGTGTYVYPEVLPRSVP